MKILTNAAMREVERRAIEEIGVPSIVLMENAAIGVVEAALDEFREAQSALIFCGPGNNGGDGLAIARHLAIRGLRTVALVATGGRDYAGDALVQRKIAGRMGREGLSILTLSPEGDIDRELAALEAPDLVIDALFGSGLTRPLEGQFAELVGRINRLGAQTVAVDLPSGLDGDRAEIIGPSVEADLTVTFAALKTAHVFAPACERAGILAVGDLGIPSELVERSEGGLELLERDDLVTLLPPRRLTAHKGQFGHVFLVAGSPGKSGAAVLAAQAAVRSGAGLVTAAVPSPILSAFEAASIETMSVPLSASGEGELESSAVEELIRQAAGKDAVAVGPGLGVLPGTSRAVREFCLAVGAPLVLDADGLNAFAGALDALAARAQPTVLTPHPGELGRLMETSTESIVRDRLGSARTAARRSGAVVILKGHRSLIARPDGEVAVNPTGNPGMATGGSGDVLTGIVAALLAQGLDAASAAEVAAWVHGFAGDLTAAHSGERSLAAGDLLESLPESFEALTGPAGVHGAFT